MKLRYTPEARADLRAIKQYISQELCNPTAADSVVQAIVCSCSKLKEQPKMGAELSKRIGHNTDIRFIITGKHFVFYRLDQGCISVVRILDGRTDYARVLFPGGQ